MTVAATFVPAARRMADSSAWGLTVVRMVVAEIDAAAQANGSDQLAQWAGLLRWIVDTLEEANEPVEEALRAHDAGA